MAKSKYIETLEEQYTKKDGKSVLRYKAPDNKWRYIQTDKDASDGNPMPSGGGITEVTWQELKDKRDNGELTPGSLYRITDYNCTTTQENTQSAGHQFDIVLLALSKDKLAEEGWAMEHPTDVYDVTFSDGIKKCYLYVDAINDTFSLVDVDTKLGISGTYTNFEEVVDKESKTINLSDVPSQALSQEGLIYNYFQNSNLSAWKVWYCLDNDTSRFAWADDSVDDKAKISWIQIDESFIGTRDTEADTTLNGTNYFAWYDENAEGDVYTTNEIPSGGEKIYTIAQNMGGQTVASEFSTVDSYSNATNLPNGRGVIYRLIDEFMNDVGYDFKNIQFVRPLTDGTLDTSTGTDTWVYTFNIWYDDSCGDASIIGNRLPNDEGFVAGVYNNHIDSIFVDSLGDINTNYLLSNNVMITKVDAFGKYYGIYNTNMHGYCHGNTISINDMQIGNICLNSSDRCIIEGGTFSLMLVYCYSSSFDDAMSVYIYNRKVLTET